MSDFLGIVQAFQLAIKTTLMYTSSHPRTQASLANLALQMEEWLEDKPNIHIAAYEAKLFLDGAPFEGSHVHLGALARQLNDRKIAGFIFQRGVEQEELEAVVDLLILKPAKIEEAGGAATIIGRRNLPHVRLSQTQYKEVREGEGGEDDHAGPGGQEHSSAESDQAAEALLNAMAALAAADAAKRRGPDSGIGSGAAAVAVPGLGPGQGPGHGFAPGGGQGFGERLAATPGQGPDPAGTGAGATPDAAFDLQILTELWEEQLDQLPTSSLLAEGGLEPANLGFLGGTPLAFGMGDGFPPAQKVEGLRSALLKRPAEQLLAVVAGLDSLPTSPAGLRMAFQSLAVEAFSHASAELLTAEGSWERIKEAIFTTLRFAPQQQSMLASLEMELRNRGLGMDSQDRLRELMEQLNWESLSLDEQINLALNHGQFWSLTLEQRLTFLRLLLDEGRLEPFLQVLDQILERLAGEDPNHREQAAATLRGITRWMDLPLPLEAETPMLQGLVATFGWEPHAHIHRIVTECLDQALAAIVGRGAPLEAMAMMQELSGLCHIQASTNDWREAALTSLWERLFQPASLRQVLEQMHSASPEVMLNEIIPFLEAGGEGACRVVLQVLGEEPDRKRRGRLIEAIRGLGEPALPALYEGLTSPTWYLVRNTLNLLADLGDAGAVAEVERCLSHSDPRVKRAAVRTLWKVGGPAAVPNLLATLPVADGETQMEIIFALGQLRSKQAVPVLAAFAQDHRAPEALRARAAETLGQIGDPVAIPALRDLAMRKGRIFTSAEATAVRVGACRGLLAMATAEARQALEAVVAGEPKNHERALLQQVLDSQLPA
jgi:hypothetical protein